MATPVVMCGLGKAMGGRVAPRLGPEFEVIQFITSIERAKSEIATLQAGEETQPDPDDVGTHNFSRPPEAVVFGRGFDGSAVDEVVKACGGPTSGLVWLRADDEGVAAVRAKSPNDHPGGPDGYAADSALEMKDAFLKIKADGNWGKGGVHTYGMRKY